MKNSFLIYLLFSFLFVEPAYATFDFELDDGHSIAFGGYLKVDLRYVKGDVTYQDYWLGNSPSSTPTETEKLGFNVRESRFNMTYSHSDVSAFLEFDLYGGGGNEVVSNSSIPRIRHAFITYKSVLAGQGWSTFMSTAALPETLDFAGPAIGQVFIRQVQLRYIVGGLQLAIENPETNGDGDIDSSSSGVGLSGENADSQESTPDLIMKYVFKGDWGEVSAAAMLRKLDQGEPGIEKSATAFSLAGKIMLGEDDVRFQVNSGKPGRYVGPGLTTDIVINPDSGHIEVEETAAFTIAYRHLWSTEFRSTVFGGHAKTDILKRERRHWGFNLIKQMDKHLVAGVEVGSFKVADSPSESVKSYYLQSSIKFSF